MDWVVNDDHFQGFYLAAAQEKNKLLFFFQKKFFINQLMPNIIVILISVGVGLALITILSLLISSISRLDTDESLYSIEKLIVFLYLLHSILSFSCYSLQYDY